MERTVIKPPELHILFGPHSDRSGLTFPYRRRVMFNADVRQTDLRIQLKAIQLGLCIEDIDSNTDTTWTQVLLGEVDHEPLDDSLDSEISGAIIRITSINLIRPLLVRDLIGLPRWHHHMTGY